MDLGIGGTGGTCPNCGEEYSSSRDVVIVGTGGDGAPKRVESTEYFHDRGPRDACLPGAREFRDGSIGEVRPRSSGLGLGI